MNKIKQYQGEAAVILAGILWGIISVFARQLSSAGLSSLQIMLLRGSIACVTMLLYLLVTNPASLKVKLRDFWCFIGTGIISLTFFSWCYFTTIRESEASIAVVLLYTSPIFVMLMSAVCFRERITRTKLIALGMTFAGCVLVTGIVGSGYSLTPSILLTGIGAGFGYALYSIFGRYAIQRGYSSMTITFYTLTLSTLSCTVLCSPSSLLPLLSPMTVLWAACVALLCTVFPYLLYTYGLARMEAGRAAILATVEPLVGTLVGIVCYRESHGIGKLTGIILIFAAILLLNRKNDSER